MNPGVPGGASGLQRGAAGARVARDDHATVRSI